MELPKISTAFLSSTVARRILYQFILCAIFPIVVLALVSFVQVRRQLNDESDRRLHQASKSLGLNIYERLLFLEAEMKAVASSYRKGNLEKTVHGLRDNVEGRFRGLAVFLPGKSPLSLTGKVPLEPPLLPKEKEHLRFGKTLISSRPGPNLTSHIVMTRSVDPNQPGRGLLIGEINPDYLWRVGNDNVSHPTDSLCVLNHAHEPLVCWPSQDVPLRAQNELRRINSATGEFQWSDGRGDYLARYWSIPMRFQFFAGQWTVVISASKADIFSAMADFKRVYPLVLVTSLLVVLLLSIGQIRRSLLPLEKLKEAARRVAGQDFTCRVAIDSRDEFQELADSFNGMTRRLGRQFHTLVTLGEIDRAILSELDVHRVVEAVLTRWQDLFSSDFLSVTLLDPHGSSARCYLRENRPSSQTRVDTVHFTPTDARSFHGYPGGIGILRGAPPAYLAPLTGSQVRFLVVLPILLEGELSGLVCLGYLSAPSTGEEEWQQARQLANQLAIAIHNSELYEEIKLQAERLSRANRVKNEFLSVMSHELRTPLTVIMGLTETMRDGIFGEISAPQEANLMKIAKQSHDLLSMINTIMDATALESEAIRVETEEFELEELLNDLRASAHVVLIDKKLSLVWDFPAERIVLRTDRNKVKRILQSLIHNAIKFSEKGPIHISARLLPATECVEFRVADSGVGIPRKTLPIIFDKFAQSDSSETRCYGGVGLGLYLVKAFARLLGGTVDVESELDVGSIFTVRIPATYDHRNKKAAPARPCATEGAKRKTPESSVPSRQSPDSPGAVRWAGNGASQPAEIEAFDKSHESG